MNKDNRVDEFLNLAKAEGTTKALMSDVVGMPDEKDEEFIRKLIHIHEKMTGGLLDYTLRESRRRFEVGKYGALRNDTGTVNRQSNMTYDFEFPNSFVVMIERYYPTMFRDIKHYRWFKKKLPGLMIRPNKKRVE